MSSPFESLPNNKAVPEHCRTAEVFKHLYSKNITPLFDSKQTKPQFYEKYSKIVPIDRCFCYFHDIGVEIVSKNIARDASETISLVKYKNHQYAIKVTTIPSIRSELNYKFITDPESQINFVGLKTFTLDTITTYIINDAFHTQLKIASTVHQYGASICPSNGIQFLEYVNGGDLRNFVTKHQPLLEKHGYMQTIADKQFLRRDLLKGILLQILTTLQYAKTKLNFLHNDLKADNVLISYTLDESTGKLRFQTKLADFGKSSVKLGSTVIHLHQQKDISKYTTYFDPTTTYKIPTNFVFVRNQQMALYYSSFDVYILFMSLLLEEAYYNTFFYQFDQESVFFKCWNTLFPDQAVADKMMRRITITQQDFTKTTLRTATKQLHDITLHNDILPKLIAVLK